MRRNIFVLLFLILTTTFSDQNLFAATSEVNEKIELKVEKYTLKNGLTVLIHEDRSMPLISYQQWFRVGSSHENPGRTGLAHFFEHMMFKGTKKYPKGIVERIVEKNGGDKNAFTTEDMTGYYTNLPSQKLELIIDIESDRMRNLLFDQNEINSEREVVKEERRMRYENSVYGSMFEQIRSLVYKTSPYRWPVIGYMADLNAATKDELREFYMKYYAPNNAVVVVAGDLDVTKTKKLIEKYYGEIPAQKIPNFKPTKEAKQTAPRSAKIYKDVQSITLAMVYPAPSADGADVYALDILASVLSSGTSSRLYKRLVYQDQLVTQVSVSNSNDKLSGELSIFAALKPGLSSSRVQRILSEEIEKIKNQPIGEKEIQKVKKNMKLSYIKGLQTMSSRAQSLANAEIIFGDYTKIFSDLEQYEKVTAQEVQAVARQYFDPKKLNLVEVLPSNMKTQK